MANANVKLTANSSEYQAQMKAMVVQMKELGSEFSLTATQAKLMGSQSDVLKAKVNELTGKVELQNKVVQINGEQYTRLSDQLKKQKTAHEELTKKVDDAKKAYENSTTSTGKNSEESKKLKQTLDQLNNELSKNETSITKTETALSKQKIKTDESNKSLLLMNNELKQISQKLKDAGLDAFAANCDKVSQAAENTAKKTALISGTAAAISGASVKMALSFEDSMAKVSTIMDTNVLSSDNMKNAILDLSNKTGMAAGDIADNVYNAISAGQDTAEAVRFVEQSTKLATAGFTESASSLDILTTILNAYGLESAEATKVSDQLIATQNLGKTTVNELAANMGKVIPTANAFGVGLDQVNTGYVKLTSNGIKTAESTTYLNAMLNEIGKTGSITDKVLREQTGKSFSELMASGSSLGDVLAIVEQEASAQNIQFTDMFSSSEAAKAGLVLIQDGAEGFNSTLAQVNDSTGATDEAFNKMQTNSFKLKLTFNEVKNTVIEFGTTLLTMLEPAITSIRGKISELTQWFNGLDDGTKKNIATVTLAVAAFAPLALGISKISKGISGAIGIYKDFRKASEAVTKALTSEKAAQIAAKVATLAKSAADKIATITTNILNAALWSNPLTWIVIGIVALVAAIVLMYNKCEWFKNMVNSLFEWIKPAMQAVVDFLVMAWNVISTAISTVINAIVSIVTTCWNAISGVVSTVMNVIVNVITTYWNAVWNVISIALGIIIVTIQACWNVISAVVSTVMNVIWTIISTVWNVICTVVSTVMNVIVNVVMVYWNIISTAILTVMNVIWTVVSTVWNVICTIVSTVMNVIWTIISTVWNTICGVIMGVMNTIWGIITSIWNAISGTVMSVVNGIGSTISDVWNGIYNTVSGVLNGIYNTVADVFNSIKNTISGVMDGAKSIISGAIDAIKNFFSFNIKWPQIKLPHFNIKGSFNPIDWLSDGIPKISVDWYASGGIMTSPTMFGMNGNRAMVGGEAGDEAILPLSFFYKELGRIIDEKLGRIKVNAYFKVEVTVKVGDDEVASKVASKVNEILAEEYEGTR